MNNPNKKYEVCSDPEVVDTWLRFGGGNSFEAFIRYNLQYPTGGRIQIQIEIVAREKGWL